MNSAYRTFSYRPLPLDYDALAARLGCVNFGGGTAVGPVHPFVRLCLVKHDPAASSRFNQSPKVAFAFGPADTGPFNADGTISLPDSYSPGVAGQSFDTLYTAWVSKTGVRLDKRTGVTLTADSLGLASQLFPTTKPDFLSLGFSEDTNLCLATGVGSTITIKRWSSTGIKTATFPGKFPLLVYTGRLSVTENLGETELACLYLKPSRPRELYVRLMSEGTNGFGTDHLLNEKIPYELAALVSLAVVGDQLVVLARDTKGRDVTLYSQPYRQELHGDQGTVASALDRVEYPDTAVPASETDLLTFDKSNLASSLDKVLYYDTTVATAGGDANALTADDKSSLANSLDQIEYTV